ncbi:hypothetical protein GCM10009744_38690 [Kribbella alba]|uniref:Uncharacterized protein n=1 Tax=Kribbella alba TaxID=190197 RepID=A0ABP4RB47_9ACTN
MLVRDDDQVHVEQVRRQQVRVVREREPGAEEGTARRQPGISQQADSRRVDTQPGMTQRSDPRFTHSPRLPAPGALIITRLDESGYVV